MSTTPTQTPAAPKGAPRRSPLEKLKSFLLGDDLFISYARGDSTDYALALANRLGERNFLCFLDQYGTDIDDELPARLKQKLRRSTVLVLVGSRAAVQSRPIREEVELFKQTGRAIIPIDVDGAFAGTELYRVVRGLPIANDRPTEVVEASDNLRRAEPSAKVVERVSSAFTYTKRTQWQRRMLTGSALLILLSLGVAGLFFNAAQAAALDAFASGVKADISGESAGGAEERKRQADLQVMDAQLLTVRANDAATAADAAALVAEGRADAAADAEQAARERERIAREREAQATANAQLQERIGSSRARATSALRAAAAEPDLALSESVAAYHLYPTAEARSSMLTSLELYPNLTGVAREDSNPIESLAAARDGAVLVSSDDTGLVLFWDAGGRRVIKRVEPPSGENIEVRVACAPGGSVCAANYRGGALTVWAVEARGEGYEVVERASFDSPTPPNTPVFTPPVFAAPGLLVTLGEGHHRRRTQEVALLDLSGTAPQFVVKTLSFPSNVTTDDFGAARTLVASPATKTIAVGYNRGVALWRTDALDEPARWVRHPEEWKGVGYITENLSFNPSGQYLAVSVNGGHVLIWNLSEEESKIVETPCARVGTYVTLFDSKLEGWPEGTYLLTASATGEMSLRHILNPVIWKRTFAPGVRSIVPLNGGGMVATGSNDGLLALWDMVHGSRLRESLAGVEFPRAFAFGRSSGLLYAGAGVQHEGDSGSRLWREAGGRYAPLSPDERRPEFPAGEFGLQLLPDESSEYIALRDVDGARPGDFRVGIKHTPSAPRAVSPDGRTLAVGESASRPWNTSKVEPTSIVLWDISDRASPRKVGSLEYDGRPVSFAFGGSGTTLAASYDNGRVVLWDYSKGTRLRQFIVPGAYEAGSGRKHNTGRVALSPDGRLLAAKSGGPVSLWDVETGLLLGRLGPEEYPFRVTEDYPSGFMVFSRDGRALVVAGGHSGGLFDLWNLDPEVWASMVSKIVERR